MPAGGLIAFIVVSVIAWQVSAYLAGKARATVRPALEAVRARWAALRGRWQREPMGTAFTSKLRELDEARRAYEGLPAQRERRLRELQAGLRQRQLQQFLARHRIDAATIKGIGTGREATLRSYGIETAADVSEVAVLAVPGFGPVLTQELVRWRRAVERRFTFNPARGVDPADIAALDQELSAARLRLERLLLDGAGQLQRIAQQIRNSRDTLMAEAAQALTALVAAEADWKAA